MLIDKKGICSLHKGGRAPVDQHNVMVKNVGLDLVYTGQFGQATQYS